VRIFDVSVPVRAGMPVWPGDDAPTIRRASSIDEGAEANVSVLSMGVHTGTHIDAPLHFVRGARGVDRVPPEALYGPCVVVERLEGGHITGADVARLPEGARRALFKTPNSRLWEDPGHEFDRAYAALTEDAARELVRRDVALVGIDYLSIEPYEAPGHPVHRILLQAGVVIVEGLDLRGVEPGPYTLACLPVKLEGADGSPARALLIRE
jgi:arylformamidase